MRTRTIIVIAVLAAVAASGLYAWKEYERKPEGAGELSATETLGAAELLKAFQQDEPSATAKFVGTTEQAVQVSGAIRAIEPTGESRVNVILETGDALAGIVCEFATADVPLTWRAGAAVTVKGICTGMLLDVVLVRCAPVE